MTTAIDPEVPRWFKAQGPGYQTRIDAMLKAFVQARQRADLTQCQHRMVGLLTGQE